MNKPLEIQGSLLARNTVLNIIGQAVPLLVGLATIPFIVRGLGMERFGLLSLAWVILGYFAIFDLGLGRATTKFVAEALGKGEEDQVPRLVWTAVTVQAVLGVVGALVLIGITPLLVERILNIPTELVGEAKTIFYLLAFSTPVVLIFSSFSGVLEAAQRFDLVNAVRIPSSTLTFLLPLIGLLLGFSLPGIVALILVARVGALAAFIVMNFRLTPQLKRYSGSFALFPRLFSFGGWVTVSSIVGPILLYTDRFVIGALLTMTAVAYYTAPFEMIIRLQIIPSSFIMTLFPAFSALGTMHRADLQRLYARSIKYIFLGAGPIIMMLLLFASNILWFWLGADFAEQSTLVFQILLLGALVGLPASLSNSLLQGLGRPDILSKIYLLYLPLYIVLLWLLIQVMSIAGAALAATLRSLVDTVLLFIISSKYIDLPCASFAKHGLLRCIGALSGFGALLGVASLISVMAVQVGIVALAVVIFIVVTWRYVLDDVDKNVLILIMGKWRRVWGNLRG